MLRLFWIGPLGLAMAGTVAAQDVGIQFDKMTVGTVYVTQSLSASKRREQIEYIGLQNGQHVLTTSRINENGSLTLTKSSFYHAAGRLVANAKGDLRDEFEPFSCKFALGPCSDTWRYPNGVVNNEVQYFTSKAEYTNQLDGDVLNVGRIEADGSVAKTQYTLGPYNLRIGYRYQTDGGAIYGYDLVSLTE